MKPLLRKKIFLLGIALLSATLCSAESPIAKFVIALKPDKNPEALLAERQALQAFLSKQLAREVEVIVPLSAAVIVEGFKNGTVDLGYLSSTELVKAREQNAAELILVGQINGDTYYRSYWVSLKNKPYRSIADLRGKPIAFASKTSTSGFVVPLWDLHKQGLVSDSGNPEEFFGKGNVFYGVGYVSAIERVFAGDAEAAAVSDYVIDKDKHLTAEQRKLLQVIATQGPVPTHVIAARNTLSATDRAALKAALLAFNNSENVELRDKIFGSKFVETDPIAHTAALEKALALASRALGAK